MKGMARLRDKYALITGSPRGIGRAVESCASASKMNVGVLATAKNRHNVFLRPQPVDPDAPIILLPTQYTSADKKSDSAHYKNCE